MKKYRIILSFLLLFLLSGLAFETKADMGPKPTADVEIIGIDEPYYFDILFEVNENNVIVLSETQIEQEIEYGYYRDDYPDILNGYRDGDGFASYTLYRGIPHNITKTEGFDHLYHLGYFAPPDRFKVVIVTELGKMYVSEIINTTAFNATVVFDLTSVDFSSSDVINLNVGTITETAPFEIGNTIILIVTLIVLTLIIELLVLLAFGYREKKSYIKVGIVNIITQILLQALVLYGYVFVWNVFGAFMFLILGEIVVLIIEIIAYQIILKEKSKWRAVGYAFLANFLSFVLGLVSLGYLATLIG
jgi:hypothetical protein